MEKKPHSFEESPRSIPFEYSKSLSQSPCNERIPLDNKDKETEHLLREIESTVILPANKEYQISQEGKKREKDILPDIKNKSRRNFLRNMGWITLGATLSTVPYVKKMFHLPELFSERDKKEINEANRIARELDQVEKDESIDQRERFIARVRKTGEFIFTDEDTILDTDVMDALNAYWMERLMTSRGNRNDVPLAWEDILLTRKRLQPYIPSMRKAFSSQGLSDSLIGITVIESRGELNLRSRAGAKGPYQFMDATGRMYGLETDADFFDPIKSSYAAARYIDTMYNTNGGSLPLALHQYNGSYALQYIIKQKREGKPVDYADFLKSMEEKINKHKKDLGSIDEGTFQDEIHNFKGSLHGLHENIIYPAKVFAAEHAMRQADMGKMDVKNRIASV
jgi:hypothetical protein